MGSGEACSRPGSKSDLRKQLKMLPKNGILVLLNMVISDFTLPRYSPAN